ncbi:hypothetical protein PYW08_012782 [Mythimna loreyi]|uniref:Uncharacterized protein n=1 Tax=Mythimna loreyi TaxID=667449 RepID=A0ACC2Q1B7_9NEOP|nr:hypothetical protein PYW08_012782 [Mythimna loreyi]
MEKLPERGRNNIFIAAVLTLCWATTVHSIDCFKCVSMNGRFPACDDPFHNNHSLQMLESPCMGGRKGRDGLFPATSCIKIAGVFVYQMLESPCMGGRKGRDGLFPATSCIKIAGVFDDTGETITVRGCGLDSGTATTDTEIIRMSHCGRFYYDDRYVHGCLQSCNDADACNKSDHLQSTLPVIVLIYHAYLLLVS